MSKSRYSNFMSIVSHFRVLLNKCSASKPFILHTRTWERKYMTSAKWPEPIVRLNSTRYLVSPIPVAITTHKDNGGIGEMEYHIVNMYKVNSYSDLLWAPKIFFFLYILTELVTQNAFFGFFFFFAKKVSMKILLKS